MLTTRKRAQGRSLGALTMTLVLALLAALLLAGTALAAAAPGKPTAKAPKGTITQAKPTFKWSKAPRAAKYEVRVYKGSKLLVRKTGITKLSWKSSKALRKNVSLTWKVRARNARGNGAWSRSLKFKIVTTPSSTKAITAFNSVTPPATGSIDESSHAIALTVPFGTNVSALVATFATTGASVKVGSTLQTSGTTANNFTSPVTYRVTAANASTQDYTVTVTVAPAPSSAKAITAFSFQGLSPAVTGVITEGTHSIVLTVPFGTNVSALVATFTTTGASVAVAGTPQVSGTTANNFTSPVTYTVTAADASTQDYTVTAAPPAIGDSYQGGKLAYILQSGDPGYVAGQTHGLIAGDGGSTQKPWWNGSYIETGASGTKLGTGFANTNMIIAVQGPIATNYAAGWARAYNGGGYGDWYLPSRDEFYKLYLSRDAIGGYWTNAYYWTSTEDPSWWNGSYTWTGAWIQSFDPPGGQATVSRGNTSRVWAVRSF